ncbi:DeoR/GlpR family DNA-binding transcription regulator [Rathayibacter sp. VKM Ac-2857]|uniref:DeoR/GlpR family DNA-binding transcription regulator n=1 Tax=Rathayibacter sp. VKM Ac-2857 TaxID=2739020 RepID=UPI0015652447|nr:DeoR/GlpR family DNA-binding transcription regulator [Rathayibacter sp. VKM Ac-2857]NQX18297.1 DeoR/GlpR transcriptional regulator [Rathayibacter sp. VKM Ac-2857]
MTDALPLLAAERRDRIRTRVQERGSVRSIELAEELGVSLVTVRRDLVELQAVGVVRLVHGGAQLVTGRVPPTDRRERSGVHVEAKVQIARAAAALVAPGDVVFLDSGTTCAALVEHLALVVGITVVTNDLVSAIALAGAAPDASVVIAAGRVDGATLSTGGELLPAVLENFVFDAVFVSASAWDATSGATTGDLGYAAVKRSAIERAKRSFLLVDASKFGAVEPYVVSTLDGFDAIITDDALGAEQRRDAESSGATLVTGSIRS